MALRSQRATASAVTRPRRHLRWHDVEAYVFIAPWFVGFLIFVLGPFLASLGLSFTRWELYGAPEFIGLDNYERMFTLDRNYLDSLRVTAYYTILAVPTGMIFAFAIALMLNQKIGGMAFYRTLYYLPSVTTGVATAILWVWLFNPNFGLINLGLSLIGIPGPGWITSPQWAIPAFALMNLWGVGGTIVIYLAGLQGVPDHLYEAAEIDGAGWWGKIRHVTIPMMTPTIFFTLVMGIIGSFQSFTQALVMTNGGPGNATLLYILYLYQNAFKYFRMGYASSMAWILFLILLVVTLIQLRLARRWVYYEGDSR